MGGNRRGDSMVIQMQNPGFPSDEERLAILGATGSGKTQAALWHLSYRNYHLMPWIVYNFKSDKSINAIPYLVECPLNVLPVKPGVYVVRPRPSIDDSALESHMYAVWEKENIGVYVDEGYMVPSRSESFQMLLTQGRSKRIPMIVLSQRPVWMNRFVFSESEFYQVFRLQHRKDQETMAQIVPANFEERLKRYHSWYYDAINDRLSIMRPVPDIASIFATFGRRLSEMEYRRRKVV